MSMDDIKLSSRFRNEKLIASGKHLIVFDDNGNEETVQEELSKIQFSGTCGLIRIHRKIFEQINKINIRCSEKSYIEINKGSITNSLSVECVAPNSTVVIGKNAAIIGARIRLAAEPDRECIIGNDALISSNVNFRTSDGHTIFDINNPLNVINQSKIGIHIGNHVWLCADVTLLKDTTIPDDCIIGRSSVVTSKNFEPHSIIAGVPARTIRTGVSWSKKHIDEHIQYYTESIRSQT
jgi:acetyltransferase-like isoleucine patch superfamily enzyme